ncbi:MAG: Oxygen-independent coproporphyrinogen-III oxidase 1 [Firmicutes bacterium ADurb.Bin193]|nr:MAG: Oxygen-independent coproporphyrinogen-III oxidase 1 [Firmicutes bacterium ADurb.Bin193]
MSSGVYIHIPFCARKCAYCDFNSYDNLDSLMEPYTQRLISEIKSGLPKDYDTVFLGGGTPTALPLPLLLEIVDAVFKEGCEFSVEANPATIDFEGFAVLKAAGVNRISLGLQSAQDSELKILGRIHSYSDFLSTYKAARRAGFDNINVDLMFSIPNQTVRSWADTLYKVVSLKPEHISCYSLIIEDTTPFSRMELSLPSEDEDREMYMYCAEFLKKNGYNHYEISNFAKDGFECRHNLKYWERKEYRGFGAGAHSFYNGARYENSRDVSEYISDNKVTKTILTQKDAENEYIFLGLRKTDGICLSEYKSLFGHDFTEKYYSAIKKYADFCEIRGGRFYLNLNGISISNTIICDFLE